MHTTHIRKRKYNTHKEVERTKRSVWKLGKK
jgi:hypothetical protein